MLKQTLLASAMTMSLFAGSAYAHVENPLTGEEVNYSEGEFNWNANNTIATGTANVGNNNLIGFHFSVSQAGTVDIFGNDFQSLSATNTSLYLFQKDAVGHDWTNVRISFNGDNANFTLPPSANNIYGVPVTSWVNESDTGQPEAGMSLSLGLGQYMALLVSSQGAALPVLDTENPVFSGFKYSAGWSWTWNGETTEVNYQTPAAYELTLRVANGSSALIGPAPSEVPLPSAVWLMGTVLAGFGAFGRSKALVAA